MFDKPGQGKRNRRRQDSARMKARARRVYPHDDKARSADHLKVCSCWMCGNPRRHLNALPLQEQRAALAAQGQIQDN